MLCLSYYASVFSSTKLEMRAEQVLPGSEGGGEERVDVAGGGGAPRGGRPGEGGRNDPNNVCVCE
jgi:hypothetical protein